MSSILTASTPRRSKAIKVIQKKTTYKLYYIGVTESRRKVARCTYTPPRSGGSFTLSPSEFIDVPFYSDFAECKVFAALILKCIREKDQMMFVATDAVNQELSHISLSSGVASYLCNNKASSRLCALTLYNEFNRHSVVCYNVGYHFDRFDKGMASLENKVVFHVKDRVMDPRTLHKFQNDTRGGGDHIGQFHFALLDWGRCRRNRRQAAIDVGIIQPNQRLTQAMINDFFRINPHMNAAFQAAQDRLNNGDE